MTLSTYTLQRPSEAPQTPPPTARLLVNVYEKGTNKLLVTFSQNVSSEGENKWEELNIGLTAKADVQVEVICENTDKDNRPVFFDNLSVKVQAVPTVLVVQENHYYPFGLGMKGLDWVLANGKENKYQYNDGTEKNTDFDLNLYETDFRTYDAQIGRFTQVDALADLFTGISPYTYSYNNPINFNDPTGLCTDCATDENDFTDLAEKYAVRAEPVSVFAPVVEVVTTYTKEVKKEIEPNLRPDNVNKKIDTFTKGVENVVEDNNLDLLPIGYMFIKAWGLYGKQILIYGGTTLASGLYGMITNGGYDVWNITEHTVTVRHHNWDKIFGDVKPSLSDVEPYIDKVLENGQWQSIKVHHKAGGEGLIMRGNVDGHSIWVEGFKDSNGKIYVKNAGVD